MRSPAIRHKTWALGASERQDGFTTALRAETFSNGSNPQICSSPPSPSTDRAETDELRFDVVLEQGGKRFLVNPIMVQSRTQPEAA
jgi:hypothetical protein